jgi:hypothetical protein
MFVPRLINLLVCSIACSITLTVAGCGITNEQGTPAAASGEPQQKMTVLVNDLTFSPDVAVIDREFSARLASKLGDSLVTNDVIKGITVKRVNDEIVATVVVILHEEAGLKAQLGGESETAPEAGALIAAGQLRAAEQRNRVHSKPVGFSADGGVAADMTLSQVSGSASTQLTTFMAQVPGGRVSDAALFGSDAAERNAQIANVLAGMNAPDIKLSPDVQAQARGLGRAIADKIVDYAVQRGWAHKTYLPAQTTSAKPPEKRMAEGRTAERRPRRLPAEAAKQSEAPAPPKPFPCNAFKKNERGNWYVKGPVTIDVGSAKDKTLQNQEIPRGFFTVGGVDLYDTIQKSCVSHPDR